MVRQLLGRLSRLNSYVRTGERREAWTYPFTKAIYTYKTEFLRVYAPKLGATCEKITSRVKCRDCDGSGRYVDGYGYQLDHCWACSSSGLATLHFVETRWPDGQFWHTPASRFPMINAAGFSQLRDMLHRVPWLCKFKPNQPGKGYPLGQVIDDLIAVEDWYWESGETRLVPNLWCATGSSWDYSRYPARGFLQYKLQIEPASHCPICLRDPSPNARRCASGRHPHFEFVDLVCNRCDDYLDGGLWDALAEKGAPMTAGYDGLRWAAHHAELLRRHGPKEKDKKA